MALLYGRAGRLTAQTGGPRPGQKDDVIRIGEDHPLLMDRINMLAHKRVKKQNERINVALPPRD